LSANPSVLARCGVAGVVSGVAVLASPARATVAFVSTIGVLASTMNAGVGSPALVDIEIAVGPVETFFTRAFVVVAF